MNLGSGGAASGLVTGAVTQSSAERYPCGGRKLDERYEGGMRGRRNWDGAGTR
ncbi:MAG: hypothetical protein ACLT8C_02570 [Akkermansia muciniphila]